MQVGIGITIASILSTAEEKRFSYLATLPYFMFIAFVQDVNFSTYNAEVPAVLLVMFSIYLFLKYQIKNLPYWAFASGFFLGLVPHTKIQLLVPAAVQACFSFFVLHKRSPAHLATYVVAVLTPTLLILAYGIFNSTVFATYKAGFILQYTYVSMVSLSFSQKVDAFASMIRNFILHNSDSSFVMNCLYVPFMMSVVAYISAILRPGHSPLSSKHTHWLFALFISSIVAAIYPGRFFTHYLLACIPFLYLFYGIVLNNAYKTPAAGVIVVYTIVIMSIFPVVAIVGGREFAALAKNGNFVNTFQNGFIQGLKQCVRPGDSLLVAPAVVDTSSYHTLYVITQAPPPFYIQHLVTGDDNGIAEEFLRLFQTSPPQTFVDFSPKHGRSKIASSPDFLKFLHERYLLAIVSEPYEVWVLRPASFEVIRENVPGFVHISGFEEPELNSSTKYVYRWTNNKTATLSFQDAQRARVLDYTLISPLCDETISITINGLLADTIHPAIGTFPAGKVTGRITFESLSGLNTVEFSLSRVNSASDKLIPEEDRQLGVQFLQMSVSDLP
jgi:hypothetical protein